MSIAATSSPPAVFDHVVCGIDGTPAGIEAARLAARLMPAFAQLTLTAVVNPYTVEAEGGLFMERTFTHQAEEALERAQAALLPRQSAELHLREGPPIRMLLDELRAERATLVALGSHGHSRAAGIVLGSVVTAMLHDAPCSVLIARAPNGAEPPRQDVLVAFDGSGGARRALAAGRELSERLLLGLRVLVATGDGQPPGLELPSAEPEPELAGLEVLGDRRPVVDALIDASVSAGLLILGSRHLRGASALGSVSERVAHRAACSVLVVR
jgi:nucleotide-binding universal stress UspA family protein